MCSQCNGLRRERTAALCYDDSSVVFIPEQLVAPDCLQLTPTQFRTTCDGTERKTEKKSTPLGNLIGYATCPGNIVAKGQVFRRIELRSYFVPVPLQDFNADVRSDGYIAFIEIHASRRLPQTPHIVGRLTLLKKLPLPAFKFTAQLRCLCGVPFQVLTSHVWSHARGEVGP